MKIIRTSRRLVSLVAVGFTITGCLETMPGPAYPSEVTSDRYSWVGEPDGSDMTGHQYCAQVEKASRDQAKLFGKLAWAGSLLAIGAATTPAIISAVSGGKLSGTEKTLNIAMPVTSAFFTIGVLALFRRESHDNQVAKEASLAMLETDDKAAAVCISAVADWHGRRGEASEAMRARMADGSLTRRPTARDLESRPPGLGTIGGTGSIKVVESLNRLRELAAVLKNKHEALNHIEEVAELVNQANPEVQLIVNILKAISRVDASLTDEAKTLAELVENESKMRTSQSQ